MKIALLQPSPNNYLVFLVAALIFSLNSCKGYSNKRFGITFNRTEFKPIRVNNKFIDTNKIEYNSYVIDTGHFSQFIKSVYLYDSTFGSAYPSITKCSERDSINSKLRTTTVQYSGHVISIQTILFNDMDSVITKIIVDGSEIKDFKDEDCLSIVPAFDLVYGKDLLVREYDLLKKKYLFLEGTDRTAQGRYGDILYGVLIDPIDRRAFLLQTYFFPGNFFFKKGASDSLFFLTSMPASDMDEGNYSLKIMQKIIL